MLDFSQKTKLYWAIGSIAYFAWFIFVIGFRLDQVLIWAAVTISFFISPNGRKLAIGMSVWVLFLTIYDSLHIIPNDSFQAVHLRDLYEFEKKYFGIGGQTLNEWFGQHAFWAFDLAAGFFYILWFPLPFAFAIWLFWCDRPLFLRFSWCFFWVNIVGFSIYYAFPAAPPWYVALNGFEVKTDFIHSAARLGNVDDMLGITLFHNLYTKNAHVFAAMPSLHAAYPFTTFLCAWQSRRHPNWTAVFLILSVGIWISAIYSSHHYLTDVLAGISTAIVSFLIFEKGFMRGWFGRFLGKMETVIR
jgi:inositol phosphorylceramide synthase catalytic subunit